MAAFPDSLMSKTYGVVKPKKIIPAGHMKPPKRYFDTIIDLDDVQILVCNQWTKEKRYLETSKKVADYLNTKVSSVIQRSMKLHTADFKKLFASLRK